MRCSVTELEGNDMVFWLLFRRFPLLGCGAVSCCVGSRDVR
jgi:hypothetical protein